MRCRSIAVATTAAVAVLAVRAFAQAAAGDNRLIAARGPKEQVSVYTSQAPASALLAGQLDRFAGDLQEYLRWGRRATDVAVIFRTADVAGVERVVDGRIPSVLYRHSRPVSRDWIEADLVRLEAIARQPGEPGRGRAAAIADGIALGLADAVSGPGAWDRSDRTVAAIVRRTGRIPDLETILTARAEADRAALVRSLGSVLIRAMADSSPGRAGIARLLSRPPAPDEDPLAWLGAAFGDPAPDAAFLRRWWSVACTRVAYRLPGRDSVDIAGELFDALHPVVRMETDRGERAVRIDAAALFSQRDQPWFPRATLEMRARIDRLLFVAPEDLRPALETYRDGIRLLERGRRRGFERRFADAAAAWEIAVARRRTIDEWLDRFDPDLATHASPIEPVLETLRDAGRAESRGQGPISRYLDQIEQSLATPRR